MAQYHLTAKYISRAKGQSAVASAAYRSTSKLEDERLGKSFNYSAKDDLLHSAILLPAGAPDRLGDRQALWNEVEAGETRKNSQVAREVEFALPRELSDEANIELARSYVQEAFVNLGMVADLNLHKPMGEDGQAKPHAHVMLTLRSVSEEGFGAKVREWQTWRDPAMLKAWRELLATRSNEALAREGHSCRVDHRSYRDRGIDLKPQSKLGPVAAKLKSLGLGSARADEQQRVADHNGKLLMSKPWLGLDHLTEHQSTFTKAEVACFVARNSTGAEQFATIMARMMTHPDLVRVGEGKRGEERYSTRRMIAIERSLASHAAELAKSKGSIDCRGKYPTDYSTPLGPEQRKALEHVTGAGDLKLVTGYAGSGKSRMLGSAREVWEAAGYNVRGAALSGIAAENLEHGSGITSRTLASWEFAWSEGRDQLGKRDVLVIDEAGMVGSRQFERVLNAARKAGAKVVLVGDPEQLQAIEAGAAFRMLAERHGVVELTTVVRQRGRHAEWMRQATKELATGRTTQALDRYNAAGMVHASETRAEAMAALVEQWDRDRQYKPERSQLILAYTRADVAQLNELAREKMRASGALQGDDVVLKTERGARTVAVGDRVMFLQNDRGMGVKNGTLGTLQSVNSGRLAIELDDGMRVGGGKVVSVDLAKYTNLEHGYASTIHKSQGATVGRTKVMASRAFDRHATYVAATRHVGRMDLHFGKDEFKDRAEVMRSLARPRAKDTTLDYVQNSRDRAGARAAAQKHMRQQAPQREAGMIQSIMAKMRQRQQEQERGR